MTKPRILGNLAQDVIQEMVLELNRQETMLFTAMSELALNDNEKAVAEMGKLRDSVIALRDCAVLMLSNDFKGAKDALKKD